MNMFTVPGGYPRKTRRCSTQGKKMMARRRNSALDHLIAIASKLPWKVSAGLALVAFTILHIIAQQSSEVPRTSNLQALAESSCSSPCIFSRCCSNSSFPPAF